MSRKSSDHSDLFADVDDIALMRWLLADLHDDLLARVGRFRQLADLSVSLGDGGTFMPGGETAYNAWMEARSSFVHGNYIATIMLCQGLAEHLLAAYLELGLEGELLPERVTFGETLKRCIAKRVITAEDAADLRRLMELRNPLSHYRNMDDPGNLSRRAVDSSVPAELHLMRDATFAISMAVHLLSLKAFRLSGRTILDEDV